MIIPRDLISMSGGEIIFAQISGSMVVPDGNENAVQLPITEAITVNGGMLEAFFNSCDKSVVVTLRKNGSDTTLKCTIASGSTGTKVFSGASVSFSAGDYINYKIDTTSSDIEKRLIITGSNISFT